MARLFDLSLVGDKEAARALRSIAEPRTQTRIVGLAQRQAAKRILALFVQAVSGHPVGVRTGTLVTAVAQMKIKTIPKLKKGFIHTVMPLPVRETLGIDPKTKSYYPAILEYGAPSIGLPAKGWIRGTVNRAQPDEIRVIGVNIGKGVERHFKRVAKRAAGRGSHGGGRDM